MLIISGILRRVGCCEGRFETISNCIFISNSVRTFKCNGYYVAVVNCKNDMRPLLTGFVFITLVFLSLACKKDIDGDESDLYGTWVKGSNLGDTLWFMRKNGKYIMRQPESFNPLRPTYSEKEYQFKDGKLKIKSFAPTSQEYFTINSFTWIRPKEEFAVTNSELFPFLSSILTYKYQKL